MAHEGDFKLIKKYKTAVKHINDNGYIIDERGVEFEIHRDDNHGRTALFWFNSIDELWGFACGLAHCKKEKEYQDIS